MQFYKDEKGKTRPITPAKKRRQTAKIQSKKMFKPVSPKGAWTPAYQEIRRTKDIIETLFEKLNTKQQAKVTYAFMEAVEKKHGTLAKRRMIAQHEMLAMMIRTLNAKCYFCHKSVKATQQLTTHHINHIHSDNRPENKAISHERCHRKHHYNDVKPRNPPKSEILETETGYFYPRFTNRFYIVRRWDNGAKKAYAHYYPPANGKLPCGFRTRQAAEKHIQEWSDGNFKDNKVITAEEATKYLVPKRW